MEGGHTVSKGLVLPIPFPARVAGFLKSPKNRSKGASSNAAGLTNPLRRHRAPGNLGNTQRGCFQKLLATQFWTFLGKKHHSAPAAPSPPAPALLPRTGGRRGSAPPPRTPGLSPRRISFPALAPCAWALNHRLIIGKGNLHADFHRFTEHSFDCIGFFNFFFFPFFVSNELGAFCPLVT